MINNDKLHYKQHKLQKTTIKDLCSSTTKSQTKVSSNPGLKASVENKSSSRGRGTAVAQAKLPPDVVSMKLDLFDNSTDEQALKDQRKFKLAVNVIMRDQTRLNWKSSLNGRPSDYKYKYMDATGVHFKTAWALYQEFKYQTTGLKISKCYESTAKGKGEVVDDISIVFYEKPFSYMVYLVIGTHIFDVELQTQGLSQAQKKANMIATCQLVNLVQKRTNAVEVLWGKKKQE